MVDSDAPLATDVGVEVLRAGGNAVDAAVAVAFALAVVYPQAGNIGGGGFAVVKSPDGKVSALDFRETAPGHASHDMFLDADKKPAKLLDAKKKPLKDARGNEVATSVFGALSAGVPGSVAGLYELHKKLGSKPWKDLIKPSIDLARKGFAVDAGLAKEIAEASQLQLFAGSKALYFPGGKSPAAGETFKNPDLAAVLERIADQGPDGFYKGKTAELIVAEMKRGNGIVGKDDLAHYQVKWRDPIQFDYRGMKLASMPPPSSGGIALALIGNILSGYDLDKMGWHSVEHVHVLAEAMRRAFADRNSLLGDPDFVKVPLDRLLSPAYGAERRATITDRATPSSEVKAGLPIPDGDHTTHFSVVDDKGGAVALTTTINNLFGSAVTVTGAGFLLNDEMDDFTVKPGVPNLFGLVQGEANAIAPNKRMLSSMAPTIVTDAKGNVILVAGARGGSRIITATWQVISNVVDFKMGVAAAVDAPRVHQQHLPDELLFEKDGMPDDEVKLLGGLGYVVKSTPAVAVSPAIARDVAANAWTGVPDPRRGGKAAGD